MYSTVFILGVFFTAKLFVVYLFQNHITVQRSNHKTDTNKVSLQSLPLRWHTVHEEVKPPLEQHMKSGAEGPPYKMVAS